MPIYGYQCEGCEHTFDALQKISDAALVDCPDCGEPKLRKLLSAPKFRLKGKGWYETDFKSDNQRNLAGEKDAGGDKSVAKDGKSDKADKADKKTDKATSGKSGADKKPSGGKASAA